MRIAFNTWDIEFHSHACIEDIEARFAKRNQPLVVLDASGGYARQFYSLEFRPQIKSPDSKQVSVALHSSRLGIEPQLLPNPANGFLYVGIDSSVFIFNVPNLPAKRLNLTSPFYWMTHFASQGGILIAYETGLLWMNIDGDTIWQHSVDDIITGASLPSHDMIEVTLLEGGSAKLDLKSGDLLR